jgi:sulfite reductase beta subunit-like hemoprotein
LPVVANAGELGDRVMDGVNGFLVIPDDIGQYVQRIVSRLVDPGLRLRCSKAATESVMRRCGVDVISARWKHHLGETMDRGLSAREEASH